MSRSLAFGIGSLFFEIPDAVLPQFADEGQKYLTPSEYAQRVRHALELVSSVDNIEIDVPSTEFFQMREPWEEAAPYAPHELGHPHRFGPLSPQYANGSIAFDLRIPTRVQTELAGGRNIAYPVENFRVDIRFTRGFPVTFVEVVDLPEPFLPAFAIFFVREFLVREFSRCQPDLDGVTFCFIGPSTFWADFSLRRADNEGPDPISYICHPIPDNYDHIEFHYSSDYSSVAGAYADVKTICSSYFGEYYQLNNEQSEHSLRWGAIDYMLHNLLSLHQAAGVRAYLKRLFVSGRDIRRLSLRVLEAEADMTRAEQSARRRVDELSEGRILTGLADYCRAEIDEMSRLSRPKSKEILSFLDSVHTQTTQIVVVVVSSILGGLVGAAITALLQR